MPGDIITLKGDDSLRNKWPLATVQDAYPLDDGLKIRVRMADTHLDKAVFVSFSVRVFDAQVDIIITITRNSYTKRP